jgi:hypothetical protein
VNGYFCPFHVQSDIAPVFPVAFDNLPDTFEALKPFVRGALGGATPIISMLSS